MLVLYETPAGYALFKLLDDGKLAKPDQLSQSFETEAAANKTVKLKAFGKFENTTDALSAVTALIEGKMSKNLKRFLENELDGSDLADTLLVGDAKLGSSIAKKLGIKVISDAAVNELLRGIRGQISSLLVGIPETDMHNMVLGLSHSLSRYKLKFSPDKVDTMIIQAIHLLDDLDKELNTYSMRVKEWYGWHFPEMGKIIVDNLAYTKCIKAMGFRTNCSSTDFSSILPEELIAELQSGAEISMGTEISDEDLLNISALCDQIIDITAYRAQLYDYLKNRMSAIAPNLTCMVGELVGARLISHAGSLLNLAKHPASTIQILGAEKALFRALKTKHDTPKYGLIYHASLVGQAGPKIKGKIARAVATKTALSIRVDALGDKETMDVGVENRAKVEARLRSLEGKAKHSVIREAGKPKTPQAKFTMKDEVKSYNAAADIVLAHLPKESPAAPPPAEQNSDSDSDSASDADEAVPEVKVEVKVEKADKADKKKKKSKDKKKEKKSKKEADAPVESKKRKADDGIEKKKKKKSKV